MLTQPSGNLTTTHSDIGGDESVSEEVSKEVFSSYVCRSIPSEIGMDHPGDIAESSSLGAIALPKTNYPLWDSLPIEVVSSGKLSRLQLEGVLYACTKHQELLHDGSRAGFFIGDGAGVGKGRQICGIVCDNWARGRGKAVWLSTSGDLCVDAIRDMSDLGMPGINVINNCQTLDKESRAAGLSKDFKEGVLFTTYSTLVSGGSKRVASRLQQIVDWCDGSSFEGCLILDECHKAKNFAPGKEGQSSKVSAAVIELQRSLPRARVVYCSATGVSEVSDMGYMERMGFWGGGMPFADCQTFMESMKKRGIGFLEMLAMEMKSEGKYVSRGLSFSGAEFINVDCPLQPQQVNQYDRAVDFWQCLRHSLSQALLLTANPPGQVWRLFWATQQRFFKTLAVSMKVVAAVREVEAALAEGYCCVIGLQSTGEAACDRAQAQHQGDQQFVSPCRDMLNRFLEDHFPVSTLTPQPNPEFGSAHSDAQVVPDPTVVTECEVLRQQLQQQVDCLELPWNFLDELVDRLGGPNQVAEMTGRRGRAVRRGGRLVFESRVGQSGSREAAAGQELDSVNVKECRDFMSGAKLVAVVSDAASTGISLHADKRAVNQRRRIHLTIELPWSADKAIQQLGRSHRSNQSSCPLYKLLVTDLGGETRFAAAVARRLQSLGALTRGDRRAASGVDLSESNFDTPLGRRALRKMYDAIVQESDKLPFGVTWSDVHPECSSTGTPLRVQAMHQALRDCCSLMGVGVGIQDKDHLYSGGSEGVKDIGDVKRFLNRILGLAVTRQNHLFAYFAATLRAEVSAAKSEGKYSEGVSDLPANNIQETSPPLVLYESPWAAGRVALQHNLTMDRGMTWTQAVQRLEREGGGSPLDGFWQSKRDMFGKAMFILAVSRPGARSLFRVCRPNTGLSFFELHTEELQAKYRRVEAGAPATEQGWTSLYDLSLHACMHGVECARGPDCSVGRRLTACTVLSGSLVPIWGTLEKVLERHEGSLSKSDRSMRAVRAEFNDGKRLVGVRYPAHLIPEVTALLESAQGGLGGLLVGPKPTQQEPVSPVNPKFVQKMVRGKKTLHDFFSQGRSSSQVKETSLSMFGSENRIHTSASTSSLPSSNTLSTLTSTGTKRPIGKSKSGTDVSVETPKRTKEEYIGPFRFPSASKPSKPSATRPALAIANSLRNAEPNPPNIQPDGCSSQCPICTEKFPVGTSNQTINEHVDACLLACTSSLPDSF